MKKNGKKFVRKYKRKGLHAYPRTLSLKCILRCLSTSEILYPRLLRNCIKYTDEEYIDSSMDINSLDRKEILNTVIHYLIQMNKIENKVLSKYIKWNNNTEFLAFQIENLKKVLIKRDSANIKEKIEELNRLIKKLDDNRNLTFIHGDIHIRNMIANKKGLYLIDWELATYGDLAYELATLFILMNFSETEKELFNKQLSKIYSCNIDFLQKDIEIYSNFEVLRRQYMKETKNRS